MLIGSTRAATEAALARMVLDQWPPGDRPAVQRHEAAEILRQPQLLEACGAAWLIFERPRCECLYDLVGHLQDHQCGTLLSRPGETQAVGMPFLDGVVLGPPDADPRLLAATLRALWSQVSLIQGLKAELTLLRLHSEGVIDQFDKLDEELRLAAQLQRDLLPPRSIGAANIAYEVLFRPTGYVSGDIYDVALLDERHVAFFLADAVGHGVPAALRTIYLKSSLSTRQFDPRAPGGRRIVPPGETLARLNDDLVQRHQGSVRTATAVYAIVDTETLEVEVARAGHPYPLHLRPDGTCRPIDPEGAMLGVFADEVFASRRLTLEPGDRLVFFSDGFELAFPVAGQPGGRHGHHIANDRYLQEFRELARGPLGDGLDHLAAKLDRQIGSLNQRDDLTVLLVEVLAPTAASAPSGPLAMSARS